MSGYPGVRPSPRVLNFPARLPPSVQACLAFAGAGLFYVSLYGQLPYHDVARFVAQIDSGRFVWDIGHIFLQPATLFWHRYLGFGESAEQSQKHINTFATALAIGIFYLTLCRLKVPAWQRILASALLAATCSVVTLAPSGHMKLLAFPFVNGALLWLVTWERAEADSRSDAPTLLAAGALLGLAGAFLASSLATVPFATLAVFAASWKIRGAFRGALANAVLFGGTCALVFGACAVFGYVAFAGQPVTLEALQHSVGAKAGLRPASSVPGLSISGIARIAYGTVNNFVASPHLGEDGRAYLSGQITHFGAYLPDVAWEIGPTLLTFVLLACIYLRAVVTVLGGQAVLTPFAFLCGAQAWTIYYGLNDPEHWFQLAAPTILLYLLTFPTRVARWTLPLWCAGTVAANLAFYAIPQAAYPLHKYEAELDRMYSKADMLVYFETYPGTHYLGFFNLPDVKSLRIDRILQNAKNPQAGLSEIRDQILSTLNSGGKVVAFSILDPHDWTGGWAALAGMGIPKTRVTGFLNDNFTITYNGRIAEMPTWRIEKK